MLNRKKGFTLVELLGVIVILGLLLLLAVPQVMGQIQNTTKNIDSVTKDLIVSSSKNYIDKNQNEYPIIGTSVYCITLQTLIDSGYLVENLTKLKSGKKMDLSDVVKIKIENEHNIDYSIEKNNQCEEVHY